MHRSGAADPFVHFEQFDAQFSETVKGLHLKLRLAKFGGRGESFADRLPLYLPGQAVVRAMAGLASLMTAAGRLSTGTANRRDRATAEIAEVENAGQNAGSLLFECGERIEQKEYLIS